MTNQTTCEFKRQREADIRFFFRRRLRQKLESESAGARNAEHERAQAEIAQRILFLSKKGRDSYLRWKARKKAEKPK